MIGRIIENTIRYSFPTAYFGGFTYGLYNYKCDNFIEKVLASHVYGSMGFAYPISIPIYLYYYKEKFENEISKM